MRQAKSCEATPWNSRLLATDPVGGHADHVVADAIARRPAVPQCLIGLRIPHPSGTAGFIVEGGPKGTRIARGESSGIAAIEARFDALLQILGSHLQLHEAAASGAAKSEGSAHTLRKLLSLFEPAIAKR